MTIGIYKLNFTGTDKVYIGQCSTDIEKIRYKQHLNSFKNKTASKKLLEGYLEFGIPTIEVICECLKEELNALENETIKIFDSFNNGFNSLEHAEDMPFPDNRGENNGSSKYSNKQIIEVLKFLINNQEKSCKDISKLTGVPIATIQDVSSLRGHSWLEQELPEDYKILQSLKFNRSKNSAKYKGLEYPLIQCPLGAQYNIENIRKFAKEHNLDQGHLGRVLNKQRKTHKGWRLVDGY